MKEAHPSVFRLKAGACVLIIRDGDFITVSPIKNSSIRIEDVVFYSTTKNKVIVHRVIGKYKKDGGMTMLIKGDATFGLPDKVNSKNLLGKVVTIERNGQEMDKKEN